MCALWGVGGLPAGALLLLLGISAVVGSCLVGGPSPSASRVGALYSRTACRFGRCGGRVPRPRWGQRARVGRGSAGGWGGE